MNSNKKLSTVSIIQHFNFSTRALIIERKAKRKANSQERACGGMGLESLKKNF